MRSKKPPMQIIILFGLTVLLLISCSSTTTAEPLPTLMPTAAVAVIDIQPQASPTSSLPPTNTPFVQPTKAIRETPTSAPPSNTATSAPPTPIPPTATAAVVILPTLTPIHSFQGTDQQFEAYIRENYSQIDGQPLGIESVDIHNESGENGFRAIWIRLSDAGANTLTNHPQSSMYLYGERLMDDGLAFYGGESFSVIVNYRFYDDYLADRYFDEEYYIGDYSTAHDAWPIHRDYIDGFYIDEGYRTLDVWNHPY